MIEIRIVLFIISNIDINIYMYMFILHIIKISGVVYLIQNKLLLLYVGG